MRKVKAFTLVEVLVAMTISLILIGVSFIGYRTVVQLYNKFQKELDEVNDFSKLHTLLLFDAEKASEIKTYGTSELTFRSANNTTIYNFSNSLAVRQQNGVHDTFFSAKNVLFVVTETEASTQIRFTTQTEGLVSNWLITKEHSPEITINRTLNESR